MADRNQGKKEALNKLLSAIGDRRKGYRPKVLPIIVTTIHRTPRPTRFQPMKNQILNAVKLDPKFID